MTFETLCAIWYHLCNLKNVKNTHGGELLLGVFTFFKLYKKVSNRAKHHTSVHDHACAVVFLTYWMRLETYRFCLGETLFYFDYFITKLSPPRIIDVK